MLQRLIIALFHFLLFTTPLFFYWKTEELFEFNKMMLTYAVTVVIIGLWLARKVVERRWLLKPTPLDLPIILFLLSQILATVFSMHPRTSLLGYYTRFHGGLYSTFTYILLYYAFVNNVKKSHLPALFFTIFSASSLVALYGILEHFGHSYSCLLITREFGVDCWVQDVKNRVFATFGQPNWLAAFAITLIPLGLSLSLRPDGSNKGKWLRLIHALDTVLLFVVLLYTKSRSGLLGLVVGLGVYGACLGWWLWRGRSQKTLERKPLLTSLGLVLAALVGLAVVIGTPFTPGLSSLVAPVAPAPATEQPVVDRLEQGGTESGEIRKIVWQGAWDVWKRYPLFGSGVETFAYSYYQDRPVAHNLVSEWDFLYNKAHNELLNYLATTGLVGLGAYLLLLGWFFWLCWRVLRSDKLSNQDYLLVSALPAGLAALSVSNFFGFSTVVVTILQFLFFGILVVIKQAETADPKQIQTDFTWWQWLALASITFATLFGLNRIWQFWQADRLYVRAQSLYDSGHFGESILAYEQAIAKNPAEALYYDSAGEKYAQLATALHQTGEATAAAELANAAVTFSNQALTLNPVHLNFYKTRARIFLRLAQIDPQYLTLARETLQQAQIKAPTDPKLIYNEALVEVQLNNLPRAIELFEKALTLKPNYIAARYDLGNAYQQHGNTQKALEQFQAISALEPGNPEAQAKITELTS